MGFRTKLYTSLLEKEECENIFSYLFNNLPWQAGVYSQKTQFTRMACPLNLGDEEIVDNLISSILNKIEEKLTPLYIYVNLYRNGQDFTPNHTHKGMKQLVISLGATRTLTIGKKEYKLHSGDVIVFGSSLHGVPQETEVKEPRISIAVFCL